MNETTKTLVFVGVAAVALITAAATNRSASDFDIQSRVGEIIKNFAPEDAKGLKITQFNEDTATLSEFAVAQNDNGVWSLASKNGYPADAEQQMGEAAGSLLDREILSVESESAANHEQFGVVDPTSPKLEPGQKGVGRRVTVSDINDEPLIDLVIGKEVKDAENQRYVREANRDFVYIIEIDPTKLSTNFEDWIESDLLKLNSWDIKQVTINDYSIELVQVDLFNIRPDWQRRGKYTLKFDEQDAKWEPVVMQTFDPEAGATGEYVDAPLADNEELDTETLNELKRALDDLKIVDVEKKPSGMSANLKTGEDFLKDKEGIGSLFDRGFTVVRNAAQELDLLSSEGEVVCTMKDGVEYVLRFGDLQVTADKQEATVAEGDAPDGGSVNRYLFVMVRMNENAVDRPELEDLPDLPDSTSAPAASAAGEESEDSSEADDAEADDADDDTEVSAENDGNTNESEDEAGDTDGDSEDAPPADADNADGDETAAIIAERKEIETQNQRKLDEYQSKLEAGRKNVEELNTRFGDWYYVISNDVFQKVHLGREDVVKEKAASGEDASTDVDVSEFGAPGAALPGVPGIPGVEGDEEQ